MADIFVCYTGEDKTNAVRIAKTLEQYGWSVFVDEAEIKGGDEWLTRIFEVELKNAQCLVAVVSADHLKKWLKKEISAFMTYEHKRIEKQIPPDNDRIIPIYLKICERPTILGFYSDIILYDWFGDTSSEQWLKLIEAISRWVERKPNLDAIKTETPSTVNAGYENSPQKTSDLQRRIDRAGQIHKHRFENKHDTRLIAESRRYLEQLIAQQDNTK